MSTDADISGDLAVDGVQPSRTLRPRALEEIAAALQDGAAREERVVVRGAGSKMDWGNPPEALDLLIDLREYREVIRHNPADLTVAVQAGMPLADLQRRLAESGQRLAIDEVVPHTTIGGLVATGLSGPLRHLYGAVRDLLIGVTVVRADGTVARSGGQVVKNVAGYDLCKLFTGSYGTLGIIAEATFRLHPLPRSASYVCADAASPADLSLMIDRLRTSQLVPSAIEVHASVAGSCELVTLFEGEPPSVAARSEIAREMLSPHASVDATAPPWWGAIPHGSVALKLTVPASEVADSISYASEALIRQDLDGELSAAAGIGVIMLAIDEMDTDDDAVTLISELRAHCEALGGALVVLRAPHRLKSLVDVWGSTGELSLMQAIKAQLDPSRRLAPGRFVGGI